MIKLFHVSICVSYGMCVTAVKLIQREFDVLMCVVFVFVMICFYQFFVPCKQD